jgi:hypothetical protein
MTFSAGIPSFSYIPRKNNGSITAIISNAAGELPITPRVSKYVGSPMAIAGVKQTSWRFVRFSATLVLTFDRSLGTFTNAIG